MGKKKRIVLPRKYEPLKGEYKDEKGKEEKNEILPKKKRRKRKGKFCSKGR